MSVRPARGADLEEICALAAGSPFSANWSREQYRAEIGSERACFAVWEDGAQGRAVAEGRPSSSPGRGRAQAGGGVRGYVLALRLLGEAQLVDIAVRPQGRGRGRELLDHLEKQARIWGCAKITLEASARNEPALRLYRKAGYVVVGRRRKFYNDGSDAILMDRALA